MFLMGTQAQAMALGWEIYTRTNDPFSLGLVALIKGIPMIVLTLPAGVMADRFNRTTIMKTCLAGATCTSLALAFTSYQQSHVGWMYLLLFVDSCFMRLTTPAGSSLMPLLLPRYLLENGVKWSTIVFQGTSLIGPALAGFILSWNLQATYILCAGTSVLFIGLLSTIHIAPAAGSLLMGVMVAHLPPFRRAGRSMLLGVFGFGLVTIGFGLSTSFWLSWACLFAAGAFDNISVVVRHTLVNLTTPDHMRGRVNAVNSIFIGSSNELGGFESGLVAKIFSPVISVVSGGVATLVVVAVWAGAFPQLREFGSLSDAVEKN